MSRIGRPRGATRKGSITRSICLPAEIYKKCIWLSDHWTKEALAEDFDGSHAPEYWSVPKVISSVLAEYLETLEIQDPSLTDYFDRCREREATFKSISRQQPRS